ITKKKPKRGSKRGGANVERSSWKICLRICCEGCSDNGKGRKPWCWPWMPARSRIGLPCCRSAWFIEGGGYAWLGRCRKAIKQGNGDRIGNGCSRCWQRRCQRSGRGWWWADEGVMRTGDV